jgi:hypothetical protein
MVKIVSFSMAGVCDGQNG